MSRQTVDFMELDGVMVRETLYDVVYDDNGVNGDRDALGRITKKTEWIVDGDTPHGDGTPRALDSRTYEDSTVVRVSPDLRKEWPGAWAHHSPAAVKVTAVTNVVGRDLKAEVFKEIDAADGYVLCRLKKQSNPWIVGNYDEDGDELIGKRLKETSRDASSRGSRTREASTDPS